MQEEEDDDVEEEDPVPRPGSTLCASLRRRHAHGYFTRAIPCGTKRKNCRGHLRGHRFVANFVWKFTGKMPYATAGDIDTTSNEHRALTLTIRTSQCGRTVWGIIY